MHSQRNIYSPERMSGTYSVSPQSSWQRRENPPPSWNNISMATGAGMVPQPARPWSRSNDIDPGMNGDGVGGWQGQGGGGRGGHHRRGMHNRMSAHHGGGAPPHRMMAPNFRQPGQQPPPPQQQQPYVYVGVPDMMDINMLRMNELSLNGGPPSQMIPQQNGMYGDIPMQGGWAQPAPFTPQEEIYEQPMPFVAGPPGPHNSMPPQGPPYGSNRGGFNRGMQQNRQGGYRHPPPQGGYAPVPMNGPMPPMPPQPQSFYPQQQQQQPFAQQFQPGQPILQHDHMGGPGSGSGQSGFPITTSTMDDYSMWTDENDEETKKKKILRDKGLLGWGDPDSTNNKLPNKWLIAAGEEESLEQALSSSSSHMKKKGVHEEALRRKINSENPQIAAQARQQLEEEQNAMMKVGKRPVVPFGWGDLPPEMVEKNEYDQSAFVPKGWEEAGNGLKADDSNGMPWNLPGSAPSAPSTSEPRNPFFAQHMQQQNQHIGGGNQGLFMDQAGGDGNVWANPAGIVGIAPHLVGMVPIGVGPNEPVDENRSKVADNLRYAVEKGHLDIQLMSLTHMPPNVLDLLTVILGKIPILDDKDAELKQLIEMNRPETVPPDEDPKLWMDEAQKIEYDKLVINVVTARIEVSELSKKINRALIDSGLLPKPPGHLEGSPGALPAGSDTSLSAQNRSSDGYGDGPPPDHCDFYDYSFLG